MIDQLNIRKTEVIDAESRLFAAQRSSNVELLDHLLHDELVAVAPSGQIITKKMDLDAHKSNEMIINDASIEIDDIKLFGDTALAIVTMSATGTMMGSPLNGIFRYVRVWKRIGKHLKVIGASILQLP